MTDNIKLFIDCNSALKLLQSIESKANDTNKIFNNFVKPALKETSQQVFDTKIDPYGVPLQPTKRKNPILVDTEDLMKGMQLDGSYRIKGDTLEVLDPTGYGSYHQFGTKNLPIRAFAGINSQELNKMTDKIKEYFTK